MEFEENKNKKCENNRKSEKNKGGDKKADHQQSSNLSSCWGTIRTSSIIKCQLSPWATVNEVNDL